MNKNVQSLKLEQGLSLTPQQLQVVRMLELTSIELEQRIEQELIDNPALEEDYSAREESLETSGDGDEEDWDLGDYASEDDIPSYRLQSVYDKQNKKEDVVFSAVGPTMEEDLLMQLKMEGLSPEDELYVRYILGNLDDEGYLRRTSMELQDDLLFKANQDVPLETIEQLISRIKQLEPVGVGAKDLQECLLLQLERKSEDLPYRQLALHIIQEQYQDFIDKKFDRLCQHNKISESELNEVYTLITHLSPRPRVDYSSSDGGAIQYSPDFIVSNLDGELMINLIKSKDYEGLRLSKDYLEMLEQKEFQKGAKKSEVRTFIKQKVDQARFFIEALAQREATLMNTMNAIVEQQRQFFLSGNILDLKPMVLKDIAEKVSLDISTISRVSNNKSVQTDYGIYPLKFFFGDGLSTSTGELVSTKYVKQRLLDLINDEDKRKPYSDDVLAKLLGDEGFVIARRTIAKYREELQLPVARLRKEI